MRQMWASEQQWSQENVQQQQQQQRLNEERDEGGGGGFDHWEREEEDGEDMEGFDLTPKHKIRTPIMEETESSVEQALRSRVGSRRLRRENLQGREGEGGGDREGVTGTRMDEEDDVGLDEEDMKLSLAENVSHFLPTQ